jgi:hypothetical protein
LDKLARSASDLFNVHKLPVTHYRLHKTLQKNPGIAGMVKNSHIREGGVFNVWYVCTSPGSALTERQ